MIEYFVRLMDRSGLGHRARRSGITFKKEPGMQGRRRPPGVVVAAIGPGSLDLPAACARALARAQAAGRSSDPGPMAATTTPGGRRRHCMPGSFLNVIPLRRARCPGATPVDRPYEILNHPIGLRMIDVKAVEFAVADQIYAGLLPACSITTRVASIRACSEGSATSQSGTG